MKRDLQKFFAQSTTGKSRFTGTVVQVTGRRHAVEDDVGGKHQVDSATIYRIGARVIILNGVIIGRAAAGKTPKVFEV